jgi:hypothetical protein
LLGQDSDGAGRYFRVGDHRWLQQSADGGGASGDSSKDGGGNRDGCGGNGLQQLGTFVGQGLRTKNKSSKCQADETSRTTADGQERPPPDDGTTAKRQAVCGCLCVWTTKKWSTGGGGCEMRERDTQRGEETGAVSGFVSDQKSFHTITRSVSRNREQ